MSDSSDTIRAVSLAALMVLSVLAGTIAFTGSAAAAATGTTNGSVSPSSVTENQSVTLDVTIDVQDVNTTDGTTDGEVRFQFGDAYDLSSASVTDQAVESTGTDSNTTNVGTNDNGQFVNLTFDDANGADNDTLTASFQVDGVQVSSNGNTDVTADVDADNDGTFELTGETVGSVSVTDAPTNPRIQNEQGTFYLGEEDVDLTDLPGVSSGQSATFTGEDGDAEGSTATVSDGADADITASNNFQSGGYDAPGEAGDSDRELFVVEPQVTDLTLYSGPDTDGADVTDGSIVSDTDQVTVEAEWNFDNAEGVDVIVEDEDGLEVDPGLSPSGGDTIIENTTQNTITFSGVDSLDTGEYTVTVEGEDDLDGTSRSATFTIRDEDQTVSVSSSTITRGDDAVVTATGTPGQYGLVRIAEDDLDTLDATNNASEEVFAGTGDVVNRSGTDTLGGTDDSYVGAFVDLDDEGEAQVRVESSELDDTTVDVEFYELDVNNSVDLQPDDLRTAFDEDEDDSAELTVEEQTINITSAPSVVRIGEEFTIEGSAPEADDVKAYARIDDDWEPLVDEDGDFSEDSVDSDGSFSVEIDSGSNISLPDSYRVAIVADPVDEDGDTLVESGRDVDSDLYGEFDTTESVSIRTVEGDLTAQTSSQRIAADVGDEVTLEGSALGQGDSVRVYLIGPRGNFLDADGSEGALEELDVDENEFDEDYAAFSRRGTYTFIVIGEGRDGEYAFEESGDGSGLIESDLTPQQAVEIVNDEYTGAGVDDQIVELTVQAENPSLTVDDFTTTGQVAQGEVTVSGTSNREDETVVFVEVLGEDDNVVASTESEVNGTTGEWSTTIDMSDVETGTYTLRADDDETSASLEFELVETVSTPTETPVPTDEPTPTDTPEPTDEPTPTDTPEPTDTEEPTTTTSTQTPGFGVLVALVALVAAALVAVRRD